MNDQLPWVYFVEGLQSGLWLNNSKRANSFTNHVDMLVISLTLVLQIPYSSSLRTFNVLGSLEDHLDTR